MEEYSMIKAFGLHVEKRDRKGKCLVATNGFDEGTEFLLEVPLLGWKAADAPCGCESDKMDSGDPLLRDLARWRNWQFSKSSDATITLEAVGRTIAHIARSYESFRTAGLNAQMSLHNALLPFERLSGVPEDVIFELHNTTVAEILAELRQKSDHGGLETQLAEIDPFLAETLLTPHVIENLCGRLTMNAILIPASVVHYGLFVILSTMNHDCVPNVEVLHNCEDSLAITLVARRAIAAGEELFISYTPTTWPWRKRQQWLQHWCFSCTCSRCRDEEAKETEEDTCRDGEDNEREKDTRGDGKDKKKGHKAKVEDKAKVEEAKTIVTDEDKENDTNKENEGYTEEHGRRKGGVEEKTSAAKRQRVE
eukprot:GEMP01046037.1.p1 GENE.GEMP01046037.1~~GEMP01046037.1.p1  ORF type:complete len:366 (-),score=103.71 GEMP01046037.1:490-1587(-)